MCGLQRLPPEAQAAVFWTQAARDVREVRAVLEAPKPLPEPDVWISAIPGRPGELLLTARDGSSRVMKMPFAEGR